MNVSHVIAATAVLLAIAFAAGAAPPTVSYQRQIRPILEKQCVGCHSGAAAGGGYGMMSRDLLLRGGRHGAAIVPGKSRDSNLVKYVTGEMQPKMPPNGALDLDTIALIRRWIDEGAKFDRARPAAPGAPKTNPLPNVLPSRAAQPAPVTALAYSPDGRFLAAGGYRAVRLLDPMTGNVARTFAGPVDQVQAVAWSGDGKFLAAAGGAPGVSGEVVLYDAQTGKIVRKLGEHFDVVYAVAWKPGSMEIATGSLDKTARLWDAATGKTLRVLKDHADAVMGVAYSPDGKFLATGSLDRSAKLMDLATGKRVAVLSAHQDGVTGVAFSPDGGLLATTGLDKTVRVWKIEIGKMENPLRTQGGGDIITASVFSPDGSLLVFGSADRVVRAYNGDASQHKRDLTDSRDWVYSVAVSPDSKTIASGTEDGRVLFWNVADFKLLRTTNLLPGGAQVEVAASGAGKP